MDKTVPQTRERILRAALKIFAECGYAAASVQSIVDAARVTKPTLYYYFRSKAGLFTALIDWAHEERYALMRAAAGRATGLAERLVEIWTALFEFAQRHRALMRIALATAFAAPGEVPSEVRCLEKARRNLSIVEGLMRKGLAGGQLDRRYSSHDLAMAAWGMMSIRVMAYLVDPRGRLNRREAEKIVRLFLDGAATGSAGPSRS